MSEESMRERIVSNGDGLRSKVIKLLKEYYTLYDLYYNDVDIVEIQKIIDILESGATVDEPILVDVSQGVREYKLNLNSSSPAIPDKSGWISVKDRLPEFPNNSDDFTEFFVTDGTIRTIDNAFSLYGRKSPWTHWMPLPELPKESE